MVNKNQREEYSSHLVQKIVLSILWPKKKKFSANKLQLV